MWPLVTQSVIMETYQKNLYLTFNIMSKSYIIRKFRATESTKNIIDDLLVSFTRATYEFFIHLLKGYEANTEPPPFCSKLEEP